MEELIDAALAEDIGTGDLTTAAVVPRDARARARIDQKQEGVLAGLDVAQAVFRRVDPGVVWHGHSEEGEWRQGGLAAEVTGPARAILSAERVALNFLGRLSGIATLTARFVRAVEGTGVQILDTRKTTPALRALERQAVVAGGGRNHRAGLYDAMLVKENHARMAGDLGAAADQALAVAAGGAAEFEDQYAGTLEIDVTVECTTLEELDEALAAGAPQVLLDNMTPHEMRAAVARATGRASIEASGGVTLDNVREIAETGVDLISVGALTHSAPGARREPHARAALARSGALDLGQSGERTPSSREHPRAQAGGASARRGA